MSRLAVLGGLLLLTPFLLACGGGPAHRTLAAGEVAPAAPAAWFDGTSHRVVLPIGGLTFTVTDPVRTVPARQSAAHEDLSAGSGAELRGVQWVLDPAAGQGYVPNYHLVDPEVVYGEPRPFAVRVVAGDERVELAAGVPGEAEEAGEVTGGASAPAGHWVAVGEGEVSLEVEYDGLVQRVDLRAGKVEPGAAAPLYAPQPAYGVGSCRAVQEWLTCFRATAAAYPYLDGAGWAAPGRAWLLVDIGVAPDADLGEVTVAGRRAERTVGTSPTLQAYDVPVGRDRLPLGGTVTDGERTTGMGGWLLGVAR